MTEVLPTTPAPERATFDEVNLVSILPLPRGVLADYVPHDVEPIHRGMRRGALETPLDVLLESEGFPPHVESLSKEQLGKWWIGLDSKVERLDLVKVYISGLKPATERTKAIYLLSTTFIDLQDFVGIVGRANEWAPQEVKDAVRAMSAELITGEKEKAWESWIDLLIAYEQRKIDFIDGLGKE